MTRARRWRWIAGMVLACVAAFATIVSAQSMQPPATPGDVNPAGPGPLERVAVQPSPDVPAPRRTAHVAPDWPAGVAGRVRYRVHLVVDATGAVAEVRVV